MPQFRIQRTNIHFFFKISVTFFFDTKCERHKQQEQEQEQERDKNKTIPIQICTTLFQPLIEEKTCMGSHIIKVYNAQLHFLPKDHKFHRESQSKFHKSRCFHQKSKVLSGATCQTNIKDTL